jgi:hypothetical protein
MSAMQTSRRGRGFAAVAAGVFVLVPVLLFWYGGARCQELSCIGPPVNAFLQAVTVIPLLLLWRARRRPIYPAMLVCSEIAMIVATLRSDFDFSPQFMVIAIPAGLVVGALIGSTIERLTNAGTYD